MISREKDEALRQILLNYANDSEAILSDAITAILGVLGYDTGKTLRDEFAMAAMPAILEGQIGLSLKLQNPMYKDDYEKIAQRSYRMADTMLEARK